MAPREKFPTFPTLWKRFITTIDNKTFLEKMIMWMSIIGSVKWYEVPSLKSHMQGRLAIRNNYFKGSHKPYNCLILLFYPLGRSRQFPSCLIIRFCFKIILRANVCPPKVRSFSLVFQQLKLLWVNPRENLPLWDVKPRGKTQDFLLRACAHSCRSIEILQCVDLCICRENFDLLYKFVTGYHMSLWESTELNLSWISRSGATRRSTPTFSPAPPLPQG